MPPLEKDDNVKKEHRCARCGKVIKRDYFYCPDCIAQIEIDNKERDRIFEEEKRRGR